MQEESGENSKNITPESPGTPTHASGSLSLSDGRDFFDDEIADQPALLFRSKLVEYSNCFSISYSDQVWDENGMLRVDSNKLLSFSVIVSKAGCRAGCLVT